MAPTLVGKQAVVVGAGMGGLAAAGALAEHFEWVVVLERDTLPSDAFTGPGRHNPGTFMRCWQAANARSTSCFPASNKISLAPGRCRFVSPSMVASRCQATIRSRSAISALLLIRCPAH